MEQGGRNVWDLIVIVLSEVHCLLDTVATQNIKCLGAESVIRIFQEIARNLWIRFFKVHITKMVALCLKKFGPV
jgi:hypothetical protein